MFIYACSNNLGIFSPHENFCSLSQQCYYSIRTAFQLAFVKRCVFKCEKFSSLFHVNLYHQVLSHLMIQSVCLFRQLEPISQNKLDGPSGAISFLQSSDLVRGVFSLTQVSNKVTLQGPFSFPLCWLTSLIRFLHFCSLCGILMVCVVFRSN